MVRKTKKRKQDIIKNCSIIAAILLIVVASSFVAYKYLFKPNNYIIQNNYYGFKLQTPKGWIAEENILFSPDYITKTLAKCKKDKSKTSHEYAVGAFRFKSQRYPQDLDVNQLSTANISSGMILEITAKCISGNKKINAQEWSVTNVSKTSSGEVKSLVAFNNNLKYTATEYVYISPTEQLKGGALKDNYTETLSKIITSLNFIK